jgi:hypothetical protein
MHTIVMFHNNTKSQPNSCKNQQCTHELSENSKMKETKSHSFMPETKRFHTLGDNENGTRNRTLR